MEEAWWLMTMISKHLRRLAYIDEKHYINPLPSEAVLKNEMQDDTKVPCPGLYSWQNVDSTASCLGAVRPLQPNSPEKLDKSERCPCS